jgi:hypothetical protein
LHAVCSTIFISLDLFFPMIIIIHLL